METKEARYVNTLVNEIERPAEALEGGLNIPGLLASIRRQWLVVTIATFAVAGGTFVWSATRPAYFKGHFQILVEPVTAESEVVAAVTGESKTVLDQDLGETQASKVKLDYETQFEVLLSRKLLEPVAWQVESQFPEISYEFLRNALSISRLSKESKIMQVEYQAATSDEVERVLDIVSRTYMAYSLKERQTNIERAIEFTDNQLPTLKVEVRELEEQLQQFGERNLVSNPKIYTEELSRRAFEIEKKLGETRIKLQQKRQLLVSLQQQTQFEAKSGEIASVLSQAPEYRKLLQQLQALETEIELKSASLTPNNPMIIELNERRARLLPLVRQAAESSVGRDLPTSVGTVDGIPYQNDLRQGLIQRLVTTELELKELVAIEQGLTQSYQQIRQRLVELPKVNRAYNSLQRQLKISSDNLENFQKVRANLLINAARQEVPWELIEAPTRPKPVVLSSIPRDVSLGLVLGLLFGCGIGILLDKFRNSINAVDELRQQVKIPILGAIPFDQGIQNADVISLYSSPIEDEVPESYKKKKLFFSHNKSSILEAFQSLYLRICTLQGEKLLRSVVVSSSLKGEGKSTISIGLAEAAAAMGKRVLLVDLNLRTPMVHEKLSLPRTPGIVEMLAMDFDQVQTIQMVEWIQNLYVVTAGKQTDDYRQYLASIKIQNLISQFQNGFFDFIIYDTPSLEVSDPLIIALNTDGIILATRLGQVDSKILQDAIYKAQTVNTKIIGIVANCEQTKS